MLIQKFKSSHEFVHGDGLVVREGYRKLRARNEASTQSQQEQKSCECETFARRTSWSDGVIAANGRNGTPIYVDWKRLSGAFWESSGHE